MPDWSHTMKPTWSRTQKFACLKSSDFDISMLIIVWDFCFTFIIAFVEVV